MAQFPLRDFVASWLNGNRALRTKTEVANDEKNPIPVNQTGSYKEYRIISSDPFPEAKPEEKGALLIVMDTGEVYYNYGSSWELF